MRDYTGIHGQQNIKFLTQYCSGDQIEKNVIGRAYSTVRERKGVYRVLVGKSEGKNHLEDPDVDGRIILMWIFRKWEGVETGWSWLRIGTGGGHL